MFLWCVQEVAELKEEDIISHTATATQLPAGVSGVEHSVSYTGKLVDLCDVLADLDRTLIVSLKACRKLCM